MIKAEKNILEYLGHLEEGWDGMRDWDWHVYAAAAKALQSCPTLCDPMDCSPPGSSIHGVFQARVLEWGAIAFSIYATMYKKTTNENRLYSTEFNAL